MPASAARITKMTGDTSRNEDPRNTMRNMTTPGASLMADLPSLMTALNTSTHTPIRMPLNAFTTTGISAKLEIRAAMMVMMIS